MMRAKQIELLKHIKPLVFLAASIADRIIPSCFSDQRLCLRLVVPSGRGRGGRVVRGSCCHGGKEDLLRLGSSKMELTFTRRIAGTFLEPILSLIFSAIHLDTFVDTLEEWAPRRVTPPQTTQRWVICFEGYPQENHKQLLTIRFFMMDLGRLLRCRRPHEADDAQLVEMHPVTEGRKVARSRMITEPPFFWGGGRGDLLECYILLLSATH